MPRRPIAATLDSEDEDDVPLYQLALTAPPAPTSFGAAGPSVPALQLPGEPALPSRAPPAPPTAVPEPALPTRAPPLPPTGVAATQGGVAPTSPRRPVPAILSDDQPREHLSNTPAPRPQDVGRQLSLIIERHEQHGQAAAAAATAAGATQPSAVQAALRTRTMRPHRG